MKNGFSHFDQNHAENFCAAVLCLVMEVSPEARERVGALVRAAVPEDLGELVEVARERRLPRSDAKAYRRGDICLLFQGGTVLVEVKTRNTWDTDSVIAQLKAQAGSAGPHTWGERPRAVVLMAPTALTARVVARLKCLKCPTLRSLRWFDLVEALQSVEDTVVQHAVQHWESRVETTIGSGDQFATGDFDAMVRGMASLRALLEACAYDIGERPDRRKVNLSGQDGRPFRFGDWAWHGVSVPLIGTPYRLIGIYRYLEVPDGSEADLEGAWLELYRGDPNRPVAYVAFRPSSLAPEALDAVRSEFRKECVRKGVAGTPAEPDESDAGDDAAP